MKRRAFPHVLAGLPLALVLALAIGSGGCGSGGSGGSGGGDGGSNPLDDVDLIVNAVDRASHTDYWFLYLGGTLGTSDWSFFTDGTGAYRQSVQAPSGRTFTWAKLGPSSLTVSGLDGLAAIPSVWTEIDSSTPGLFTVILDGNPTARTLALTVGTIINPIGPAAGELFLTHASSTSVRVRDKATLAEVRSLSGGNTLLSAPSGIDVDLGRQEFFVANTGNDTVTAYSLSASGNTPPLRRIVGASTGLAFSLPRPFGNAFNGISVDSANGEVFAVNDAAVPPSITVYNVTDTGDVTPLRVIKGAATTLGSPYDVEVDATNNEVFVTHRGPVDYEVVVFGRTANGDVAPVRILELPSFSIILGVAVDPANGELWVAGATGLSINPALLVFARTANGTEPPLRATQAAHLNMLHRGIILDVASGEAAVLRNVLGATVLEILDTTTVSVIDSSPIDGELGLAFVP